MTDFVEFIMAVIQYIKDLVKYFRDKNDGKDVQPPKFPTLGGDKATDTDA